MSIFTPITRRIQRIQAALSPQQMSRQLSKPSKSWMDNMYGGNYTNPDDRSYEDYDEMYASDPQVRGATNLITQLLLSRKLVVTAYDETPAALEQKEFIKTALEQMDYPLRQVRSDLYTAIQYGYSVGEKVFRYDETLGYIVPKRIKALPIDTIQDCFEVDDDGEIINVVQNPDTGEPIPIPIEKCIKYTHGEKFGNPYGASLYQSIYDNWYQKRKILKWWNVFLQKHEGPTLVGKVGNPSYKDLMREQLEQIMEGRTNITVGQDDEVSVLESSHRGEGFQEAIRYHDTMILHGMNIPPLLIGQDQDTGSYGQSKVNENILFLYLDGVHEDIASEFEKLVKQLCTINFPEPLPPIIGFEPFEEQDLLNLLTTLKPFIDNFTINPGEKWLELLIKDVVERYSDVTVELEEDKEASTTNMIVQPTPEQINEPLPEEQASMIDQVIQSFPGTE